MGIETLNEDLELNIPMFDDDMDIIAKLDDEPNAVGGLTAAELKAEFDRPGKTIQKYLNETLVPSLIGTVAEESVRAQNEYIRVTNENQRIINEEVREEAETAREQAEKEREKTIKLISDLTVSADTLPAGEKAQVEKTVENGAYSLKLKIPEGKSGRDGDPGPAGADGKVGPTGPQGPRGEQGPAGKDGKDGQAGPAGADGKSPTISVEEKTFAGDVVYVYKEITVTNPDGTTETFELWNGKPGPAGAPGKVFCPVIDDDGNLSWRVYNGNDLVPMPPTVNIKGPKGDPGDGSGGGVSKASELDNDVPFVSATEQSLTEEQKEQARENIGVENVLESIGGDTLTWDYNTEGLPRVDEFYKISDATPRLENYSCAVSFGDESMTFTNADYPAEEVQTGFWIACFDSVLVVFEEAVGVDIFGLTFSEPGTYLQSTFLGMQPNFISLTIPGYTGFAKKQIKEEYIPESVPRVQTAAVGQTIVVSEVDADGKPTRWEAVEFPAGGGDEEWELIVDYTVPETVNGLTIDKDLDGNSFELKRWLVLTVWLPVAGVTINHEVKLGFTADSTWGTSLCQTFSAPKDTETMGASLALCGVVAGNQIIEHYEQAQNKTNVAHQLRAAIPNPVGREVTQQGEFKFDTLKGNATCLKLCGYQAGCVHAGSIVKMWGVRA